MKGILITAMAMLFIVTASPLFAGKSMESDSYTIPIGGGISIHMTVTRFDAQKHKIRRCQILDWSGVCLIDGKPVFGTDLELPKNQLTSMTVNTGSHTINLDVSCMYNPFFDKIDPKNFTSEKIEVGYLIRGSFSDGAGSYDAEWLVIQSSSVRTKLVNKE